jgi:hypothetical protein
MSGIFMIFYSVLIASTGLSFKAFSAGYTDEIIPVKIIMIVIIIKNFTSISGKKWAEYP